MNRVSFWLTAKTQYNLHSTFLYGLYNEVLFARTKQKFSSRYEELTYKFRDSYDLKVLSSTEGEILMEGDEKFGRVLLLDRPHKSARFEKICQSERYNVCLDLYDVAVFLDRPRIARQSWRLKRF